MWKVRRKCKLNSELTALYPFIKRDISDSGVFCTKCTANFLIANGGKFFFSVVKQIVKRVKYLYIFFLDPAW